MGRRSGEKNKRGNKSVILSWQNLLTPHQSTTRLNSEQRPDAETRYGELMSTKEKKKKTSTKPTRSYVRQPGQKTPQHPEYEYLP